MVKIKLVSIYSERDHLCDYGTYEFGIWQDRRQTTFVPACPPLQQS